MNFFLGDIMDLKGKRINLTFLNGEKQIFNVISIQDDTILVKSKSEFKTLIPFSAIMRIDIF